MLVVCAPSSMPASWSRGEDLGGEGLARHDGGHAPQRRVRTDELL
jgi:hypothetical protein